MLKNLTPKVKELIVIYGTSLIITIFSGIFFIILGYPLVVTATGTLNIKTPPIYMVSIFIPYGILIGELIWIWNEKGKIKLLTLFFFECIIVAAFSFIRYIIGFPFSGHAIILFFYLPHQAINNRFQHPLRFLIGLIVLLITGIYKLFLWNDPITFLLGAILGIALWLPGFLYRLKNPLPVRKESS